MLVLVIKGRKLERYTLDEFHKEYGEDLTPKCTGEYFWLLQKDEKSYIKYNFPNPACMWMDGGFKYVIYKGNQRTIINGVLQPPADFVDEDRVFASEKEVDDYIHEIEERESGKTAYIDCPDGRRIMM